MINNMSMRSTARKVKIEDLSEGEYVQTPEGEPNYLVTPWDQELLRANIIGTIVDKFIRDDEEYAVLHLDDGSGTIRAKAWSEDVGKFMEFEVGDLVTVVGKVREYEGEIHIVPEIIRELEDPNWELVRELEILENRKKLLKSGQRPDFGREEEVEEGEVKEMEISTPSTEESDRIKGVESLGESLGSDSEEPQVSEDLKDKVLLALDKLEGEEGADLSELAEEIDEPESKTEKALGVLLNEDKIYEPLAGRYKRLG